MITVTIAHYNRHDNLRRIVGDLRAQSIGVRVFVWNNNSKNPHPVPESAVDWWLHSSRNVICAGRWWMAAQAETEYTLLLDDDLTLADEHVLRDSIVALNRLCTKAIGPTGVVFIPGQDYRQCEHRGLCKREALPDQRVDMIKGRFVLCRTGDLRSILPAVVSPDAEDIHICSLLGDCHIPAELSRGRFIELSSGPTPACARTEHYANRERARRRYFPGR